MSERERPRTRASERASERERKSENESERTREKEREREQASERERKNERASERERKSENESERTNERERASEREREITFYSSYQPTRGEKKKRKNLRTFRRDIIIYLLENVRRSEQWRNMVENLGGRMIPKLSGIE